METQELKPHRRCTALTYPDHGNANGNSQSEAVCDGMISPTLVHTAGEGTLKRYVWKNKARAVAFHTIRIPERNPFDSKKCYQVSQNCAAAENDVVPFQQKRVFAAAR
ncbi:MAG: hypothetical protein PUE41_04625, partial [bacterium]|nr:hypothetical protein [bacterium]